MTRSELNRANTIEAIKDSFIGIYRVNGIDKVRIADICRNAQVSKSNFYNYFCDKYEILEVIEDEMLTGVTEINRALTEAAWINYKKGEPFPVFSDTANYIWEHKKYFKPLLGPNGDPSFRFRWKKQMKKDIRNKLITDKRTSYDLDIVSELFTDGIIGLYTYWFYENPNISRMSCQR
jgi:AcrR family transcriptional regulator